jgi:hypothetical protein
MNTISHQQGKHALGVTQTFNRAEDVQDVMEAVVLSAKKDIDWSAQLVKAAILARPTSTTTIFGLTDVTNVRIVIRLFADTVNKAGNYPNKILN